MLFTVPVTFALALTAGPAVMPMQHAAVAPRYEAPIMKKCAGGGVESNRVRAQHSTADLRSCLRRSLRCPRTARWAQRTDRHHQCWRSRLFSQSRCLCLPPHLPSLTAYTVSHRHVARVPPPLAQKKYRLKMRQMIWKADTAEKFNTDILSADTERILLKQNWRVRHSMAKKIRAKAAQLEVEIPEAFGSFNVKPVNTPPQKLVPSIAA
jgi:hypothetical protein|tara:strand:- start:2727 stop:3353 length:627 start_codon:yes stop_codon:yes gene_type:complete